jgi:hypothetical protein
MAFLIVVLRAFVFLVALPIVAYGVADIFLPRRGFVVPVAGTFDLGALAAAFVFALGFLIWAQRPAGERKPPDDSAGSGFDFDGDA